MTAVAATARTVLRNMGSLLGCVLGCSVHILRLSRSRAPRGSKTRRRGTAAGGRNAADAARWRDTPVLKMLVLLVAFSGRKTGLHPRLREGMLFSWKCSISRR